jgi:predicted dehydrogenase
MTKVAVVGTGSAGRRHLTNLAREVGCEQLVAVSEHGRRAELIVDGEPIEVVHDYAAALGAVDAVVIANPTSHHLGHSRRAIDAGCHVLCEKPLAMTSSGVSELVEAGARAGVVVAVGCQFRFHRLLLELRHQLGGGALGSVLDVDATQGEHLADYHPDEDYRRSYAARSELGGGVLLTQIHQIDILHWLFGPFERVFATGGHRTGLELDVEDTVTYLLEASGGAAVRGHIDYIGRPKRMELTVTGTRGRLRWDYYANELRGEGPLADARAAPEPEPFDRNQLFVDLIRDFLGAIDDGRAARTSGRDGLDVLRLVDAMKRSMQEGRSVEIGGAGA